MSGDRRPSTMPEGMRALAERGTSDTEATTSGDRSERDQWQTAQWSCSSDVSAAIAGAG
jgi:hypothetical protein